MYGDVGLKLAVLNLAFGLWDGFGRGKMPRLQAVEMGSRHRRCYTPFALLS